MTENALDLKDAESARMRSLEDPSTSSSKLDIYSYLDYRTFCRDFYQFKKKSTPGFSFRSFAKKASVASSYLKHVIDGTRNLSTEMSVKFGHGMGLSPKEIDYFENLVRFNQAPSLEEKSLHFDRLRRKRARALRPIGLTEAADLLSNWYVLAIKEIVVNLNSADVRLIQKFLRKKLPEALIQKTIEDLSKLGWLQFDSKTQTWTSSANRVQFPDEVKSYVVRSYHRQMLELAIEALEDEITDREYGAMLFTIPVSRLPEVKEKMKDVQKDLISFLQEVSQTDESERRVYHLGLQCFSLQRSSEGLNGGQK